VLRKFKGYYFINTRCEKESWKVEKIQLSKGELSISSISTKLELDNLKEITETPQDTIPPYNFKATKKQFKEFVKNNGFRDTKTFIRK
jgi:Holliday junction resolvase